LLNSVLGGVMGLSVGDALGVPVEFSTRAELSENPVVGMGSFGTYSLPAGTWSDDTSMTMCLAESLCKGLDYKDIMDNFLKWITTGAFTPFGKVFGVGNGTRRALEKYARGVPPLKCGGTAETDNGNGSLMRILPLVFYLESAYGLEKIQSEEAMTIIHNVSSLTHAHSRSLIACGIYISVAAELLRLGDLAAAVETGIGKAIQYYFKRAEFNEELKHYQRLSFLPAFVNTPKSQINSSGYVVDTLEAAIWCLLNTKNYKDSVLMAVNLGGDTDTVAAVTGGLAGLYYGYNSIPKEWLAVIVKRDYIESLCNKLYKTLKVNNK